MHARKHLTLKQLTLGVSSRLRGRNLTQAMGETKKILSKPKKTPQIQLPEPPQIPLSEAQLEDLKRKKRARGNERGEREAEERDLLNQMKKDELEEVVMEVGRETEERVVMSRLRTKDALIKWLIAPQQWPKARGVIRLWGEWIMAVEPEPKEAAE